MNKLLFKKNIFIFSLMTSSAIFLTACGEPEFSAEVPDVIKLCEGNSKQISIIPNGEEGVGLSASYIVDDKIVDISDDGTVVANNEGTTTLHVTLTDEKGRSSTKDIELTVDAPESIELGAVSMTVSGKPCKEDLDSATCVGANGSMLVFSANTWTITHDAPIDPAAPVVTYEYFSDNDEICAVSVDGVITPIAVGEAKISEYAITDDERIFTGWYTISIVGSHEHKYTKIEVPTKCTEKGFVEYTCKEFNIETGTICNDTKGYVEVAARGHNYYTAKTTWEPGYIVETIRCSRCGNSYTRKTAANVGYDDDED